MSTSHYWQKQTTPYNSFEVTNVLKTFNPADLNDPITARRWL